MKADPIRIGDKFGEWTVIDRAEKPYYSLCRCSCGNVKEVNNSTLRLGKSKSCGHIKANRIAKISREKSEKAYIGKKFGKLYVVKRVNSTGESRYLCRCDCGNEIIVEGRKLGRRVYSCGCLKSKNSKKLMEKIKSEGHNRLKDLRVDGTNLSSLYTKVKKNNTSGYTGVSYDKRSGKYRAYLTLNGKQISLGSYNTAEEAYKARLAGEEKYYKPILKKYEDKINKK
ncbi:AP2 domain-containing protein [uncultured Anaerococcus sp.]|uniref:AP2 domain-containing protein n=1 Tax=uncultured Anaerococcus sp. TaxID=293428 RepID=UPI00280A4ED8|nr:AP2 domain-containing protein [uncultured Anaerococcus sp.]